MSLNNRKTVDEAVVDGKKPIAEKKTKMDLDAWSPLGNALTVPPQLLKKADQEGFEFRWLSAKGITKNSGYHQRGWHVYKVENPQELGLADFHIGRDPDGTLRRGTMILGFKPKFACDDHRARLKRKADLMNRYQKNKADDLRTRSRDSNLGAVIHEGYEENG